MGSEDCGNGDIASAPNSLANFSNYWKSVRWDRIWFVCSFDCHI